MTPVTHDAPERVLQFGTGRFLRGFVDAFLQEENQDASRARGGVQRAVTVVESSGSGSARRLRAQGCRYRLLVRGLDGGRIVDESRDVDVIDRAIDARHEPEALARAALGPELSMVVSNTTEAGYQPGGFPALLATVLEARAREGMPGVTILPCELLPDNGRRLRDLVVADARERGVGSALIDHMEGSNVWAVTLVDRIATAPADGDGAALGDPFAVVVEPYASWVIEASSAVRLPRHPAVQRTADVQPFALRKIRVLNGAHTALVSRTRDTGIALVREAMAEPAISSWLEELLLEEVVPALGERIIDGEGFVRHVLERLRNPFQDHRLSDIGVGHAQKVTNRLLPTYGDYLARFGQPPRRLAAIMATEGQAP